ncbi:hypothetical protein J6S37_00890, partial [Candidatus Saccharibacteria bacterium]|nr:hypothetical protein [Candidatus Saccharibacteria bacterium]
MYNGERGGYGGGSRPTGWESSENRPNRPNRSYQSEFSEEETRDYLRRRAEQARRQTEQGNGGMHYRAQRANGSRPNRVITPSGERTLKNAKRSTSFGKAIAIIAAATAAAATVGFFGGRATSQKQQPVAQSYDTPAPAPAPISTTLEDALSGGDETTETGETWTEVPQEAEGDASMEAYHASAVGQAGIGAVSPAETQANVTTTGERAEAEKGIKDGYGERGMYLSEGKTSPYAFAKASEVAAICGNDVFEMMKYAINQQAENAEDYIAFFPRAIQPEGFEGISLAGAEEKLESLSPDKYEAVRKQLLERIDQAFARITTVDGPQKNAYARQKDPSKGYTHDNMELVQCTTNEHNLEVVQFYWLDDDGNEIGHTNIKITPVYDEEGNIIGYKGCMQAISSIEDEGIDLIYGDLPVVEQQEIEEVIFGPELVLPTPEYETTVTYTTEPDITTPYYEETTTAQETTTAPHETTPQETKETKPEPTTTAPHETTPPETTKAKPTEPETTAPPETTPQAKNEKAEEKNAGVNPGKKELKEEDTPKTNIEEDQANVKAIEEQKKAEEEAAKQAEEASRAQADEESRAAKEAARRRQEEEEASRQAAEEASKVAAEASRAAEEASKAAERAAEEEARKAAEEEARRASEEAERLRQEEEARKAAEEEARLAAERADAEAA